MQDRNVSLVFAKSGVDPPLVLGTPDTLAPSLLERKLIYGIAIPVLNFNQ